VIDNYFKLTVRYVNEDERPPQVRGIHPRVRRGTSSYTESNLGERVVSFCFPFCSESSYQLQEQYKKALDLLFALGKLNCQISVWDPEAIEHHRLVSAPGIGDMSGRVLQDSAN
jgi:hypothetical protein